LISLLAVFCIGQSAQAQFNLPEKEAPVTEAQMIAEGEAASLLRTLKGVTIPAPANLSEFVRDRQAAIALGKALFWDMQIGSDGITSCATCHFHAGADSRNVNTLAPALLQTNAQHQPTPDRQIGLGANHALKATDFPFHKVSNANDRHSRVIADSNDIVGSQGVMNEQFVQVLPRRAEETRKSLPDSAYQVGGVNTRRVAPRNSPSVINSVFYLRNFWDGRAQDVFNGVNPFGARDPDAYVLQATTPTQMAEVQVRLRYSSLASQAVGPPISDIEMSASGRSFADLGKKLLGLRPLARQIVHREDSVFGSMVHPSGKGLLSVSYQQMIEKAFQPVWWQGVNWVEMTASGTPLLIKTPQNPTAKQFNHMSWNFALFFGLAIQMYESTLVSDDSPFDRYAEGSESALTAQQKRGLAVFKDKAKCAACHNGPEFSAATVSKIDKMELPEPVEAELTDTITVGASSSIPDRIERMVFASPSPKASASGMVNTTGRHVVYDNGFYNIGVRPSHEDLGIGAYDPFGNPLAEARLFYAGKLPEFGLPLPFFTADKHYAPSADGSFKTPSLRNVELTAPYFHNGGQLTLRQVIDFYNRGGDYRDENIADMPTDITDLGLTPAEKEALVAFMISLTDARVKFEQAPFDHPQLFVPNGHPKTADGGVQTDAQGRALTTFLEVLAVGRSGGPGTPNFPLN
jgi:cytochrome c peroxidase